MSAMHQFVPTPDQVGFLHMLDQSVCFRWRPGPDPEIYYYDKTPEPQWRPRWRLMDQLVWEGLAELVDTDTVHGQALKPTPLGRTWMSGE